MLARSLVGALLVLAFARTASSAAPAAPPGAFSLTAPANAAVNVPLLPTLTWTASAGATTYILEVASDVGFTNIVLSQVGIVTTSYTPGAPVGQGITVFWRVTAVSVGGTTLATGAPFSFTTVILPPAAFALNAPADAATGVVLQPTFDWAASAGAASYTLEVATDSGFASIVATQAGLLTTTFIPGAPLTGGTNYYWRVTAVNPGGSTVATGAPFSFQTLTTGPGAFALQFPPHLSTGIDTDTSFAWGDASGVTSYTLDVATDPAFASPVFSVSGIPGSFFSSVLNLTPSTVYYWRVTAVNGSGTRMGTGAPFKFTTSSISSGSNSSGFVDSSGSCGLLGLELLVPGALLMMGRRRRTTGSGCPRPTA